MQTAMKIKLGLFGHYMYMQNGRQQKNIKCDVGNHGWEWKRHKT